MSKITHSHINYCPMSKVNDIGQPRVKSCPGKSILPCDVDGPENECSITSTDYICDNFECRCLEKLDKYALDLEISQTENAKLKAINTQFRILMLMPDSAERLINKGELDFSGIKGIISRQRQSWESCDDTTILYMLEYHQKFSESYAQFAHERNSKINLKKVIADKATVETKKAIAKVDTMKQEIAKSKEKLSEFGKAVAGYVKIGMKEERAKEIVRAMGIKET
jgi:hypothetical protein